ncbi:MAG: Lpg1974 family pore-forming outer membrane protein [Candidatus Neptunochlamydia sp.]|nr:Lpg1974 family pore-forming outer membrane protein [Candidatus Neptunochlamydia sp.]
MKRSWMLAFFLGVMGFAFAHPHDNQPKPILYYSDGCDIKITPNAGPRIEGDWNAFLTADFIYWTVRQGGMSYAINAAGPNGVSVCNLNWDWDPGFKLGFGFNLPHDGWDIFAEYTWIQTSPSDSTQDRANPGMTPYWEMRGFDEKQGTFVKFKADWDVHYNNVTVDLGRNAYLSQYMKLRLFAGLQAAWINQDYTAQFDLDTGAYGKLKADQDFWGIGLRTGLNNSFQFTKNFSFFTDLYLAFLWGKFDLDRHNSRTDSHGKTYTQKTDANLWTEEPVADIAAGFRYDGWFAENRFHCLLQVGWEHQLWILHNKLIQAKGYHTVDLILQGLTIKARLDF